MPSFRTFLEILFVSFKLGCISFGGPIAHLGYFYDEYVKKRKWLDEKSYADLIALCQLLPGPASSQAGIGIGVRRGGLLGGIASFIGFTLPSVIVLILFALMLESFDAAGAGWIRGLKIVAVAVVAHAVLGMAAKSVPDLKRQLIAVCSIGIVLLYPTVFTQVAVIIGTAAAGLLLYRKGEDDRLEDRAVLGTFPVSRGIGITSITLFFGLLIALPPSSRLFNFDWLALFDSFYRSGALVFGGGHIVLPLLEQELVPAGWLSEASFLTGYGATQAVPGPLFTFAAYLGTIIDGWATGLLAIFAIFLPAFLLIIGALPFWEAIRSDRRVKSALLGVNAGVLGILIAALYSPIWTSSILSTADFVLATILFSMLKFLKWPPWTIVLTGAAAGMLL